MKTTDTPWPLLEPEPPAEPTFILVVDDDPNVRQVLSRVLARQGHHVAMAGNGREALAMLNAELRFSLILLDIQMPEMNGMAALPFIRMVAPGVPVVLISGHLNDDSAKGVLRTGADGVIPKPFELKHMTQTVERIIERRRLERGIQHVA